MTALSTLLIFVAQLPVLLVSALLLRQMNKERQERVALINTIVLLASRPPYHAPGSPEQEGLIPFPAPADFYGEPAARDRVSSTHETEGA